MLLLSAEKINKSYIEKKLLKDVSFYLNDNEKVGIIGINGTGKSTFLKIIAGLETADSGVIIKANGIRIGYLPQNPIFDENVTILDQVFKGASSEQKELMLYEAKTILNKLGMTDFYKDVKILSGGEKKRIAIASALINPCDILILDEPTNHIDSSMVEWLENYLQKYTGSILMVTHDRYFLDRITNKIIEINNGNLYSYQANYSKYIELKNQREEMEIGTERKNKSLYKKELEWIKRGVRARGTKSKSRIERFDELSERDKPILNEKLGLNSVSSRLGKKTVEINCISKEYNNKKLIYNFEHNILRDERIGIIGKNGSGKSTLLKMIKGDIKPDSGTIVIGDTVKIGYFSQECAEMNNTIRVIDYIKQISDNIVTVDGNLSATQMLEKFLFPADLQWTTLNRLSGGEKRRLSLLKVIIDAPNILLFDEPTNDLDIQTLEILEEYLENFNGAVIAVSHDRYFLDKVVDSIWELNDDGIIKKYLGGYSEYLEKSAVDLKQDDIKNNINNKDSENRKKFDNTLKTKKLIFTFKEQREYETIDTVIADLENRIIVIEDKIQSETSNYKKLEELLTEKSELKRELDEKTNRWLYLNDLAEKIKKYE
ncbi:MAG: hypothetical protein K0S55_1223 [Clostridia bacterium]|nr:hypothetical protein [Clostridia bacterium]